MDLSKITIGKIESVQMEAPISQYEKMPTFLGCLFDFNKDGLTVD